MNDGVANLRPTTAIGVWSIGALAVAGVTLAGDRTFFRAEPASAGWMTLVGLTVWLAIVWPIVTGDRLTQAFVVGQGSVLLLIATASIREAIETGGAWFAICTVAIGAALGVDRAGTLRIAAWTAFIALVLGSGAAGLLRTAFASRW